MVYSRGMSAFCITTYFPNLFHHRMLLFIRKKIASANKLVFYRHILKNNIIR